MLNNKVYIETYGCQMNLYDTELVESILISKGFEIENKINQADIIMLNTCSVREHANDVVYNRVHKIRHLLKEKSIKIGILGCMASNLKDKILKDHKLKVDFIVGPDSYEKLPHIINKSLKNKKAISDTELTNIQTYENLFPNHKKGVNAWIAIMRGCNNFCAYCVVPYTRGRERSRPLKSIYNEIENLAAKGFKQVTLLGQNVNSYLHNDIHFSDLIKEISKIEGIKRIRFMSPHPKDLSDSLIEELKNNQKLCKHIHLPLQAGNDRILKEMNRKYTQKDYLLLVKKIKEAIPLVSITTDIIIGFPSETAEEFEDTVEMLKKVEYDSAFIFKYSERKDTYASKHLKDDVSEEEKKRRIIKLNDIQKAISLKKHESMIGSIQEVLVESITTKKSSKDSMGRTDNNKIVIMPSGSYDIGDIIKIKITSATANILKGVLI